MSDDCDLLCLDLTKAESIRAKQLDRDMATRAAEIGRALADPTRLVVAAALAEADEMCGCDLAWVTGRSQKLVSHHLKVLRSAGLVSSRRDGKVVFHALTDDARALLDVMHVASGVGAR